MLKTNEAQKVADWQVQSLRFTLFRTEPTASVVSLWETLTGQKPEKYDSQPRANRIVEEGTVVLGSLAHISDPFTVTWTLSPSQEQQQRADSFPTLGSLVQIKGQFIQMMNDWLTSEAVPETNRIALGSISVILNQNKAAAYKQLSTFLPHLEIDIENSTDLLYQINRPIRSTAESSLIINRLSKWRAIRLVQIGFQLMEKLEQVEDIRNFVGNQLELDINTSQHNKKPLSKEKLVPLLEEFSRLANQISTEGDR